jgi:beta-glucosidase
MCAYNAFRGHPACASPELLQEVLRGEWGFDGYVVSDCWAIMDIYNTHHAVDTPPEAAALAMAAGTDLNCGVTFDSLGQAVGSGLLTEETLDAAVRRLLRARFRLGMFDPPDRVPWASTPYQVNDSPEHQELALEAALKSMVLLKNEGGLLPLGPGPRTIAVIGPNADDEELLLGNYNGFPSDPVTPLRGIREAAPPGNRILYARGTELAENLPFLETIPASVLAPPVGSGSEAAAEQVGTSGLRGLYFANGELRGEPFQTRVDEELDFRWWGTTPLPGLDPGAFSIRWTGTLTPEKTGAHALGAKGLGDYRLFLDDSLVAAYSSEHEINTRWTTVELKAGAPYHLRLEFKQRRADGAIHLVWDPPGDDPAPEALRMAEEADVVVLVLGLSPRLEGEEMRVDVPGFGGGDRVEIGLPLPQRRLMEKVVATGKPVVLVLLNGSALAVPRAAETIPAILEGWYPGQAGGRALGKVLFGEYNPGGRLPLTFYRSVDQLLPFTEYAMEGRTYRYFRGDPLFPFGHGLSYTTFSYGHLELPHEVEAGEEVELSVTVGNTGPLAGEEVVQLYVTDVEASVVVPIRSLQGVQRIRLEAGEVMRVTFTLTPWQLSLITDEGDRVLEPGLFEVSVGGKQPGFSGWADAGTTDVMVGQFEVIGRPLRLSDLPREGQEER